MHEGRPIVSHEPTASTERKHVESPVPPWAAPLLRVADGAYPIFLCLGVLLLILQLSLLGVGRAEFPWLPKTISIMCGLLMFGYAAFLIAKCRSMFAGWFGVVIAVGIHYGYPFLLAFLTEHGKVAASNPLLQRLTESMPNLALYIGIVSAIQLGIGYALQYMDYMERTRARRGAYIDTSKVDVQKPGVIPKCWQMSRCRPAVRMTCPNFLDRVNCWQRRSGCFCDRDLANYLASSVNRKEVQEVIDMQQTPDAPSLAEVRNKLNGARRPWKLQKSWCYNCPIFMEHQDYKYKRLGWLSFPATVGLVAVAYPFYHLGYNYAASWLDSFSQQLVKMGRLPENFQGGSSLSNSSFEYLLLFVLGVLLFSYVISLTETIFLKWKL